MKIVFFDFDGTITSKDTFPLFIKYSKNHFAYYIGVILLTPILILYLLGIIPAGKAKQIILKYFFKGEDESLIKMHGQKFIEYLYHNKLLKDEMLKKINHYKTSGVEVVVVSASIDCWIRPFCEKYNIAFICTELEFINRNFTGKLRTLNCQGREKKRRILEKYDLKKYTEIIVYGNSSGDKEMISLATEHHWII